LNNIDNTSYEDEIKIPRHLSAFSNIVQRNSLKSSESGDAMTILSQIVSKSQRKKSLALINEDEEEIKKDLIKNEESEKDLENSNLKDIEKLIFEKNKKKKKGMKDIEESSKKKSEKGKINKNERDINNNDDEIYITDEENDIDDEDSLSEKNQKFKNTCDFTNNFSYINNNKSCLEEEDEKININNNSKFISSFNDSQDNFDLISKDKDLDSDETKIPNYFIKERNIRDFINKSQQNTMSIDFKSNNYE
jgi:hypothetical protein